MAAGARRHWLILVPERRYLAERLYRNEILELWNLGEGARDATLGDQVALAIASDPPAVFALGEVRARPGAATGDDAGPDDASGPLVVAYTRRFFDDRLLVDGVSARLGPLTGDAFTALARRAAHPGPTRAWLVSVDLPIEADTEAEAVRQFWTYVRDLGPAELPAFVSPAAAELAMTAYVRGEPTNLDPEEDEG